jgi:predicted lipoprotein with Yx(FWY)xxD motif
VRRMVVIAAASVAIALVAAGCGGKSSSSSTSAPASSSAAGGATIAVRTSKLGSIMVDGNGRTLYLFEKDKGTMPSCYGACAGGWPPYTTTGAAQAGSGTSASLLATTSRTDGKTQVTYHGHPLYHFAGDSKPGDTNGEGLAAFGAKWYALAPSGNKIDTD